ncbi:MAG TPA: hypothetical protein VMC08_00685 [Bacteroidales bacterium]|nr:hypothetical protein [Bacteroidales bacterium]
METTNQQDKRYWHGRKGRRGGWIILAILGVAAFIFLFGAVIMWLWNALMPVIFHLGVITYWQAVGLAILARLLFGSMHGHSHHRRGRCGPWGRRFNRYHDDRCRDYSYGDRWRYYEQYWNEEGEKAFDEYIKRKSGEPSSQV